MSLIRSAATVGGTTLLSRLLGFLRDVMVAAAIGTGPIADAFFVAFRFPNMFRSIFAEGAFNSAFVPLFSKRLEGEGSDAARRFAEDALSVLLVALLVITLAAEIAMPWIMLVFAPGFSEDPQKFDWAVQFTRIAFPYLLFISLTALQSAILNSLGRFFPGAAAPVMLNVTLILAILFLIPVMDNPGEALAWGVAAAGVVQFFWLAISLWRAGFVLRLRWPKLTPDVRRLFRLGVPGVIAGGIGQVNLTIGTMIASLQAGAVSWLYYADRIYQLPLAVIGIAIGVVLLPDLSRRLRGGDGDGANWSQNRAVEVSMLLTVPAAIGAAVLSFDIIRVLFERGAFTREDTAATALALIVYAAGLPAFVLNKVFSPAYFAREDTMTPLRFAAISIVVNIVTSFTLFWYMGFVGIAIGTTVAAWVNTGQLGARLWRRKEFVVDAQLARRLPLTLMAAAGMGVALWFGSGALAPFFEMDLLTSIAALFALIAGGALVYFFLCQVTGAMRMGDLRRAFTRR
ncbi:murein biosynthesis integral membrane protein MurJ [Parvibaculum sp.]|uniref:murein biosynthesis integral membrane protein MurJ n=1 Tax=Parvibaculum sp. TaxID=2024848 RepID=UPI0027321208|nr:murein biosynthesis integral membrane protein MurJ [Parvibaculum sp.]MDP1626040.1 murein biosynthesis integral membrane protein MurJ [Parvibaculum sp.]MDP2149415.1 murein biosynthesis integral membrane protein MurJ [Parvibaculum sp.]MDP3328872.1 murein biosynthesis integral membrane protein MurJ [Parvibaculum sp.]